MKNIELTEDHKSKLLEMCFKLLDDNQFFTEFRFLPVIKTGFFNKSSIDINFIQWINQTNGNIINIHWFEFCVNCLSRKLYLKLDKRKRAHFLFNNTKGIVIYHEHSIFNNYYLYFEKEYHLIDYLYEVFKKSTKNV